MHVLSEMDPRLRVPTESYQPCSFMGRVRQAGGRVGQSISGQHTTHTLGVTWGNPPVVLRLLVDRQGRQAPASRRRGRAEHTQPASREGVRHGHMAPTINVLRLSCLVCLLCVVVSGVLIVRGASMEQVGPAFVEGPWEFDGGRRGSAKAASGGPLMASPAVEPPRIRSPPGKEGGWAPRRVCYACLLWVCLGEELWGCGTRLR